MSSRVVPLAAFVGTSVLFLPGVVSDPLSTFYNVTFLLAGGETLAAAASQHAHRTLKRVGESISLAALNAVPGLGSEYIIKVFGEMMGKDLATEAYLMGLSITCVNIFLALSEFRRQNRQRIAV